MADNKLEVQIVLDDGSIQKGFVKLEQQAEKTASKAGKSFDDNLSSKFGNLGKSLGLVDLAAGFFLAEKAVKAFGAALNQAIDSVLAGEKLQSINKQFDLLSQSAGISAANLKDSFGKAADGLVDDSALIEVANKALINLGESASDLPKLLEIARKSSSVFGGDVASNFEAINQAIITGSTKQLKALGIVVDSTAVYENYAKSIGRTADQLVQYEKQQALLNEVIRKGNDQFKNVDASVGPATDGFTRLKVSSQNLIDNLEKLSSKLLGKSLGASAEASAAGLNRLSLALESVAGTESEKQRANLELLNRELEFFEKKAKNPFAGGSFSDPKFVKDNIASITEQIRNLTIAQDTLNKVVQTPKGNTTLGAQLTNDEAQRAAARNTAVGISEGAKQALDRINKEVAEANKKAIEQQTKSASDQLNIEKQLTVDLANFKAKSLNDDVSIAQKSYDLNATQANLEALINARRAQENERFAAEQIVIATKYQNLNVENQDLFNQLKEQQAKEHQQRLSQIELLETDKRNKLVLSLTQIAQAGLNQAVSFGLQTVGASLVKGGSAFANFGATILGILGDVAIQMGQLLIAQGFALNSLAVSLASFNGAAAIAAGAALVVLGGALKALSGGAGASSSGGGIAVSGGSGTSAPVGESPVTPPDVAQARDTGTKVEVTINGSVFDNDQTGLRIVDLINDAVGRQGAVITERIG